MNPQQIQSYATSGILYVLGIIGTALVTKGVMTQDQANALGPEIATAIVGIGSVAVFYWKAHQHTPAAVAAALPDLVKQKDPMLTSAVVAAVNSTSVPGVKAVDSASTSPTVNVDSNGMVTTVAKPKK